MHSNQIWPCNANNHSIGIGLCSVGPRGVPSMHWIPGLGDATHTHHRYQTTNICHNVVLGSYWLTTSLYSIVPGLGGPSQSLVTSQGY